MSSTIINVVMLLIGGGPWRAVNDFDRLGRILG